MSAMGHIQPKESTYSGLLTFVTDKLHAAHSVLLHLDICRQLLGQLRSSETRSLCAPAVACTKLSNELAQTDRSH